MCLLVAVFVGETAKSELRLRLLFVLYLRHCLYAEGVHCAFALLRVLVVVASIVQCLVLIFTVRVAFCVDFGVFMWEGSLLRRVTLTMILFGRGYWSVNYRVCQFFGPIVGGGDCLLVLVYVTYSGGEEFLRYENGFISCGFECFWSYWLIWI